MAVLFGTKLVPMSWAFTLLYNSEYHAQYDFIYASVEQKERANKLAENLVLAMQDTQDKIDKLHVNHDEAVNAFAMPGDHNFWKDDHDLKARIYHPYEDQHSQLEIYLNQILRHVEVFDRFLDECGWRHAKPRMVRARDEVEKAREDAKTRLSKAREVYSWRRDVDEDDWTGSGGPLIAFDSEAATKAVMAPPFFHTNDIALGHSADWRFLKLFSSGQANAALWAKADGDGNVERMVVRKDDRFSGAESLDYSRWIRNSAAKYGRQPLETYCHELVQYGQGARNIVRYIGYEIDWIRYQYRIYTEFCRFASLSDWRDGYAAFPEDWLWMIFEKLVECGLVMEKGGVDKSLNGWPQVVHRDLKPLNIFVDDSRRDWPGFVQPKLGDFGYAILTKPDDENNPDRYTGPGTEGYRAPEQCSDTAGKTSTPKDRLLLLAHTNVWGIGVIMQRLMENAYGRRHDQPKFYSENDREYRLSAECQRDYPDLSKLVKACLAWQPWMRPTFSQLRDAIKKHISGSYELSRAQSGAGGDQKEPNSWPENGLDRYKIGMAFPAPEEVEQEAEWADWGAEGDAPMASQDASDEDVDQSDEQASRGASEPHEPENARRGAIW